MADLFTTAKGLSKGYDQEQVAKFFAEARKAYERQDTLESFSSEQIRTSAFDLVRGGYDVPSVDAALNRLEAAFIQRDRSAFVAQNGETAWFDKVADEATTLYPRLLRPAGERFRHPEGRQQGYSVQEVDALLDHMAAFFDDKKSLTEGQLRSVTFRAARGTSAYDEAQVDAFIGRAIQVLVSVS